ncbi:hypothetical protein [Amaricoccus macauensis]|uniref:hypothetical protein n=1 Tax=Amaricoccus macauensis TaxID=57001 RepID=UPI003C79E17C
MDIVKASSDWARAEMLSAAAFIFFGVIFLLAGFGFRQLGTTDMARAFVIPMLVAGGLLLILGAGLFFPSQARLSGIPATFAADPSGFLAAEIARADKIRSDYSIAVFRIFPAIITLCAVAIPFLQGPVWRASLTTAIAMFLVLILVDMNASARLEAYREQLASTPTPG